ESGPGRGRTAAGARLGSFGERTPSASDSELGSFGERTPAEPLVGPSQATPASDATHDPSPAGAGLGSFGERAGGWGRAVGDAPAPPTPASPGHRLRLCPSHPAVAGNSRLR